ncbi:hypothetical protein Dform_01881 [Dehalogenimonas formicexedens]|uniref:Uncharacterized protein n=1 Tax=Dehalogenimonas formicexedens TaxID=1839801 RepID=A0A1P8F9Q7_9CHLR|nr:hypothetical protein [Dehalogenimonas formicexedens]APV45199.1 hypothetical protein Dform_01881 [Dehalogenimonas formicexedens]
MGKKINVDKLDADRAPEEVEDSLDAETEAETANSSEEPDQAEMVGGIDVSKIIKAAGGIQSAVNTASPSIDQFASQARIEAQRASALAMKEYRRQMQAIVGSMQSTIREEGVRLADEICARITTQIRQAVLLETEKKALNLVDEFVLGWQIEAESMSQDLLAVNTETTEDPSVKPATETGPQVQEAPSMVEKPVKPVEADEKEAVAKPVEAVMAKSSEPLPSLKKPEIIPERAKTEQTETEKKVVFDFATFIAQTKSPLKI